MTLLEVPVDHWEALEAARAGGAQRLELCSALDLEGLTPRNEFVRRALALAQALPVFAMVRPRAGDFCYDAGEFERMLADIRAMAELGVQGIVAGALTAAGQVDVERCARLVEAAHPLPLTFHRAFDAVRDPETALEQLAGIGVRRILTSGGAATAWAGRERLRDLVARAGERLLVLPGGGVRVDHAQRLIDFTGAREIHSSTPFRLPARAPRAARSQTPPPGPR